MKCLIFIALCLLAVTASPIEGPQTVIVNGNDVPLGNTAPYHVHILLDTVESTLVGSGVFIGGQWVLTVAQNLQSGPTALRCGFGNRDRNQLIWVAGISYVPHPDYNSTNLDNNIAVIQLASNPSTLLTIVAIPLAVDGINQAAGVIGTIFGFGFTANGNFAQILQQAQKTIQTDAACLTTYPHLTGRLNTNFCALSAAALNTPSMCGGDQGGPFVVNNVLVGLSSFIWSSDCFNGQATAFTRISAYRPWIFLVIGF